MAGSPEDFEVLTDGTGLLRGDTVCGVAGQRTGSRFWLPKSLVAYHHHGAGSNGGVVDCVVVDPAIAVRIE